MSACCTTAQCVDPLLVRAAEIRSLEAELAATKESAPPNWLHGPAASIEQELSRRRHLAEIERLEGLVLALKLTCPIGLPLSAESTFLPSCTIADKPLCWSQPHADASPAGVLAERRRAFGDQQFHLWVEDCVAYGGVRIWAMDTSNLAKLYKDVCDGDIQTLFHKYCYKARRKAHPCSEQEHEHELCQFLLRLLDAIYFEFDGDKNMLMIKLPDQVEPIRPQPANVLVEIQEPQDAGKSVSKNWIRQVLLVPHVAADQHSSTSVRSTPTPRRGRNPFPAYAAPQPSQTRTHRGYNVESQSRPRSASISSRSKKPLQQSNPSNLTANSALNSARGQNRRVNGRPCSARGQPGEAGPITDWTAASGECHRGQPSASQAGSAGLSATPTGLSQHPSVSPAVAPGIQLSRQHGIRGERPVSARGRPSGLRLGPASNVRSANGTTIGHIDKSAEIYTLRDEQHTLMLNKSNNSRHHSCGINDNTHGSNRPRSAWPAKTTSDPCDSNANSRQFVFEVSGNDADIDSTSRSWGDGAEPQLLSLNGLSGAKGHFPKPPPEPRKSTPPKRRVTQADAESLEEISVSDA